MGHFTPTAIWIPWGWHGNCTYFSVTVKRTILSVAYPLTDVGADAVGGSEQILTILDRSLTEAGHRSIVIAAEGSKIAGKLIASPKSRKQLDDSVREWARQIHRSLIQEALAKYAVDLVHMHSLDFHNYVPINDVPVLATLHLPPDWYPGGVFRLKRQRLSNELRIVVATPLLSPVSAPAGADSERRGCGSSGGQSCQAGLRTGDGADLSRKRVFTWRWMLPTRAGVELVLAGQVFPYESHLLYFKNEIQPRLDGLRRFVGPLGFARKKRLLAQAKCLIIPSLVAETSSLVAMESLACGTPVIALRSGALPEIVEHGRTGFVVSDVRGIARALLKVDRLDPDECRMAAQVRFSAHSMAEKYLGVYEQLIRKSTRN